MNKLSITDIETRTEKKFGDKYEFISEYRGMDVPVLIKHIRCGKTWTQTHYNFLKGIGCSECNKKPVYNEIDQNQYNKFLADKYDDQFTILEYKNAHEYIKIRHNYFYDKLGNKGLWGGEDIILASNLIRRTTKRSTCKKCRYDNHFKCINHELLRKEKFCLYMHVNKVNHKKYIGITCTPLVSRWNSGFGYNKKSSLYYAIKKYGWNNFSHFVLYNNEWLEVDQNNYPADIYKYTFDEVSSLEKEYISNYRKKYGKNNIYNRTNGGEGLLGINEIKVNQYSKKGKFIKSYESIKRASEETSTSYRTIIQCCRKNCKTAGGFLWKYSSDKSPLEIPKKIILKNIPVSQYTMTGKFVKNYKSYAEASKETGISNSSISACCNNKIKQAGNYQWKITGSDKKISSIEKYNHRQGIFQYTLEGTFVKKYSSMAEAERVTGSSAIWNSCSNIQAQSGGYIWVYDKKDVQLHLEMLKKRQKPGAKRVYQYDLKGKLINIYSSIYESAYKTNINRNLISKCCRGIKKQAKENIYLFEREDWKEEIKIRCN